MENRNWIDETAIHLVMNPLKRCSGERKLLEKNKSFKKNENFKSAKWTIFCFCSSCCPLNFIELGDLFC